MELNNPTDKIIYLFENSKKSYNSILKELKLSPTAYNEWKKGKSKPTIKAINKIADYFNVSTDYIFGRTNNQKPDYPKIKIENNSFDMTFWTNEKLNLALENISKLIDFLNSNTLLKENLSIYVNAVLTNLIKLQAMFCGIKNNDYLKDIPLIEQKGFIGYLEYKQKHGIKEENINNLIYDEQKDKKD